MSVGDREAATEKDEEEKIFYKEAFEAFDQNRNGTIPTSVSQKQLIFYLFKYEIYALMLMCMVIGSNSKYLKFM